MSTAVDMQKYYGEMFMILNFEFIFGMTFKYVLITLETRVFIFRAGTTTSH